MQTEQIDILLNFFKALADESRLKIVGILANQESSVEQLALQVRLKEPIVSHHLEKLSSFHLVSKRVEGDTHFYRFNSEVLQNSSKAIFHSKEIAPVVENEESEFWAKKVLHNFLVNEPMSHNSSQRLKEIPAHHKKRLVILKWLAKKFEIGVNYQESAVNETLKSYHPDYATLRRELIVNQLMRRENGLYWRLVNS